MKIQVSPWVRNYTVNMEHMYTEITLEKIENKPSGCDSRVLESYVQLFKDDHSSLNEHDSMKENINPSIIHENHVSESSQIQEPSQGRSGTASFKQQVKRGKKTLFKGHPGVGKTTLSKKIAWDWAMGHFTIFRIVLFVSLKLVRPGNAIESIVAEQYPVLEMLNISKQKARYLIDTLGHRCLLILDGLDEHELGSNDDIEKILTGKEILRCNLLVTSRPHSTKEIENSFQNIAVVKGFTKEQTNTFISRFNLKTDKKETVRKFSAKHLFKDSLGFLYANPVLLLCICSLVKSDGIDLSSKTVELGEVYWKLVLSLYKKYLQRKRIAFDHDTFVEVLKRVGKIAWKSLQSGSYRFEKTKVIKDVGDEAFDYGFLIGHENFQFLPEERADISVTFLLTSIQVFLGAFYLLQKLDEGDSLTFPDDAIFMTDHVFFEFCLWFLNNERTFTFTDPNKVYTSLVSCTVEGIDFIQLDLKDISERFPIFRLPCATEVADNTTGYDIIGFVRTVLSQCQHVKELYFGTSTPVDWVLKSFRNLGSIQLVANRSLTVNPSSLSDNNDTISYFLNLDDSNNADAKLLDSVVQNISDTTLISLFTVLETEKYIELPTNIQSLTRLSLVNKFYRITNCQVTARRNIPTCPNLTDLSFVGLNITQKFLESLAKAPELMPKLNSLSFEKCDEGLKGKLSQLFNRQWKALTQLRFYKCYLNEDDMVFRNGTLPNLSSLVLSLCDKHDSVPKRYDDILKEKRIRKIDKELFHLFKNIWSTIVKLWLHDLNKDEYKVVVEKLNNTDNILPRLDDLGICMWKHVHAYKNKPQMGQKYSEDDIVYVRYKEEDVIDALEPINAPHLKFLTFQRFICSPDHLVTVTESSIHSDLDRLDISHSRGIAGQLSILVGNSFPSLNSLVLSDCGLNSQDLCSLAQASLEGRLPQLRHLDISQNAELIGEIRNLFPSSQQWKGLISLHCEQKIISDKDIEVLAKKVKFGCLSSLQKLQISGQRADHFKTCEWPNLKDLSFTCPENTFARTLSQISKAVQKKLFPNLNSVILNSLFTNVRKNSSPRLNPGRVAAITKPLLDAVQNNPLHKGRAIASLCDLVTDLLCSTGDRAVITCDAFQTMIDSMINITVQCMEQSRPLDWEALCRVAGKYYDTMMLSESENLSLRSLEVNMVRNMGPFLLDIIDFGRLENLENLENLSDLKYRLRKCGVRVYVVHEKRFR